MRAIKSRIGQLRGLFWGCLVVIYVLFGVIRGTWLVFGGGCRNDATKMHNVVGDLLNPTQRYEKFLIFANFGEKKV